MDTLEEMLDDLKIINNGLTILEYARYGQFSRPDFAKVFKRNYMNVQIMKLLNSEELDASIRNRQSGRYYTLTDLGQKNLNAWKNANPEEATVLEDRVEMIATGQIAEKLFDYLDF
jgi:3-isopropylmalate dehydratase small subunit